MRTIAARGKTILVVEDHPATADALGDLLRDAGYTVAHEPRGRPALARLLRHPPDLLLLDLGLSDIDGMEVCRIACRHVPDLPVVILTGRGDARDVVTGLGVGADDCMHKPIDGAVLLARITAVLRGHAAGRRST